MTIQGVIPVGVVSVTATVFAEQGTANVHLALFTMPTYVSTGTVSSDNALVVSSTNAATGLVTYAQADIFGLAAASQSLTVNVPTGVQPVPYIVRLWADTITGYNVETISRDATTAAANLPPVPTGVQVLSMVAA
jgi:hypothetical protein